MRARRSFEDFINESGNYERLLGLARSPSTDPDLLDELSTNLATSIRIAVSGNPNTRPETIRMLYRAEPRANYTEIAANPGTPIDMLLAFAEEGMAEGDYWLLNALSRNPATPEEILDEFLSLDSFVLRQFVAGNPNTGTGSLMELAIDEDPRIRKAAADNPKLADLRDYLSN
jgi:hypothetical protein